MNRYTQAADDLRCKAETGIISAEEAIDALHGLAIQLCEDADFNEDDAEKAIDCITDAQIDLGITEEKAHELFWDTFMRSMRVMFREEI